MPSHLDLREVHRLRACCRCNARPSTNTRRRTSTRTSAYARPSAKAIQLDTRAQMLRWETKGASEGGKRKVGRLRQVK